jgi:hypothetical protein
VNCTAAAYAGAFVICSLAPHAARGMIGGEPASDSAREGTARTGLHTNLARSRLTLPVVRYRIAVDGPTHQGLPRRHNRDRRPSGVVASGRSSSASATRHGDQRPVVERVRKRTAPSPCQRKPTRLKTRGGSAASATPDRAPAVAANADAGIASATVARRMNFTRGRSSVANALLLRQVARSLPDRILTK